MSNVLWINEMSLKRSKFSFYYQKLHNPDPRQYYETNEIWFRKKCFETLSLPKWKQKTVISIIN